MTAPSPLTVVLPTSGGGTEPYRLGPPTAWPHRGGPATSRRAYAAAHVVADPLADNTPGAPAVVDWESTMAFRRHLWSYGLGVADAMDTAQRGMGLSWDTTAELVRRSAKEAQGCGGALVCGVGTDHAPSVTSLAEVTAAYLEQLEVVEGAGSGVVLMASRQLAALARDADDYLQVYSEVLAQASSPVVLHWLGPAFDPLLEGYWGATDPDEATGTVVRLIEANVTKVDGIKVSLLDAAHEVRLRRLLPDGVLMYTGDDFNYPELIAGDSQGHSHALLGIFDPIAPAAAGALQALDEGDEAGFRRALDPTVPLARHLFAEPTYYYKTGIVFLAWLCGHQPGFTMVGGLQSARSLPHLAEVFRLADRAGLLPDPELAAHRMRGLLSVAGVS